MLKGPILSNTEELNLKNKSAALESLPLGHLQDRGLSLSWGWFGKCHIHSVCSTDNTLSSMNGKHAGNTCFLPRSGSSERLDAWCTFFRRELWAGEHSSDFSTLSTICHLCSQAVRSVNRQDLKTPALPLAAKESSVQRWPRSTQRTAKAALTSSRFDAKIKQPVWNWWQQMEPALTHTFSLLQRVED